MQKIKIACTSGITLPLEEIIFIEKDNSCNEYYGFDDIEARYELNR